MLELKDVTLVCVEGVCHRLAEMALEDCLSKARFGGGVVIYSDKALKVNGALNLLLDLKDAYAASAALWNEVPCTIETPHALAIQYDSGILDVDAWTDEFLDYDYIGAPWGWFGDKLEIGNGGFSLRSKKLMMYLQEHQDEFPVRCPEDILLCRTYRPILEARGFKWAPPELASQFSIERSTVNGTHRHFGYHGIFNWQLALDGEELRNRLYLARQSSYIKSRPEYTELPV